MNSYTNISIFGYDLIVQKLKKPFEVRVAIKKEGKVVTSMPSNKNLEKILYYLGEEGFLDDGGVDSNEVTWIKGEPKMRLAVGYLPSHKFKQLKYKLEQHG
jgi:ribosomal protein S8|tara:strand:+ start:213 stop:515 length:303 start_codon:yes stop_codon:yes gene_type:complete